MSEPEILPNAPKLRWWAPYLNIDRIGTFLAIAIAAVATYYSAQQYDVAVEGVKLTKQAVADAKRAGEDQAKDVERSRKAAEESASAAAELAKGMVRSARAAEMSADIGRAALGLNRRAMTLENMPLLQIVQVSLLKPLTPGEKIVVTTKYANRGRGVAYRLSTRNWIAYGSRRTFDYPPDEGERSIFDAAPGPSQHQIRSELPGLSIEDIRQLNEKRQFLYVFGIAEYSDDIVDNPRKYSFHWCSMYLPGETNLGTCPEHNHTAVK